MKAVGNRAACALPCLGSSRWRSWEGAFPTLQSNGVSEVNGDKEASGHPIPRAPCSRSVSREVWPGRAQQVPAPLPARSCVSRAQGRWGAPSRVGNGWQSRERALHAKGNWGALGESSLPATVGRERGKKGQSHQQRRLFWEHRAIARAHRISGAHRDPRHPSQHRDGKARLGWEPPAVPSAAAQEPLARGCPKRDALETQPGESWAAAPARLRGSRRSGSAQERLLVAQQWHGQAAVTFSATISWCGGVGSQVHNHNVERASGEGKWEICNISFPVIFCLTGEGKSSHGCVVEGRRAMQSWGELEQKAGQASPRQAGAC